LLDFSQSTAATQIDMRIDGGAPQEFTAADGATAKAAFNSELAYVASRKGVSQFMTGNIYQLITVGKTPTTPELNATENFVAQKTKGSLA
jgi:hypothetical protein